MVKPLQRAEIKSFVGGLVTDAPRLDFPDNASRSEINFDCLIDGSRKRRNGFATEGVPLETNTERNWSSVDGHSYNQFIWDAPGGAAGMSILVIQFGDRIFMYDSRGVTQGNNLLAVFSTGASFPQRRIDFARVQGFLISVDGSSTFTIYSYTPSTKNITSSTGRVEIRDVFGVEETLNTNFETDVNHRGFLNYQHYYNLYNQGWAMPRLPWLYGDQPLQDAVELALHESKVPSNADTVWQGMDFRTIGRETVGTPPSEGDPGDQSFIYTTAEAFHKQLYLGTVASRVVAAKGFFIIDAFARGLSRKFAWNTHHTNYPMTGNILGPGSITSIPDDVTNSGFTCVTEHAGRAFFSGIIDGGVTQPDARSPNLTNFVFFSQLVKNRRDIGRCYQEGDPTSREGSDVVDTDGGFLRISGAVGIRAMRSLGHRLLVFASNGVWAIVGQEGGFTATNFTVEKICNFGCASATSIVVDGRSVYYWGSGAIYRLTPNQFGDLEVVDMTTSSLKQFYGGILEKNKVRCVGYINKYTNVVHWVFNNKSFSSVLDGSNIFELRYDVSKNAFYPMRLSLLENYVPTLLGGFICSEADYSEILAPTPPVGGFAPPNTFKYWGIRRVPDTDLVKIFFGKYDNGFYKDWVELDAVGVDAPALILTGDQTGGDMAIDKQVNYLTIVFKNNQGLVGNPNDSSCMGRVQWEFSDLVRANRWSSLMQMYRKPTLYNNGETGTPDDLRNGYEMITTKTRLRGHGKAFCFLLQTEEEKDLHLIGWSLTATSNGVT